MGSLVISYDCEGVWGMLDNLGSLDEKIFNRDAIITIYRELVRLHEDVNMKATFAFVGAFVSTRDVYLSNLRKFDNAIAVKEWTKATLTTDFKFSEEILHIPELIDIVKMSSIGHELACHGYSHVIMDAKCDDVSLQFEISSIKTLAENAGLDISTIIFPRNVVSYQFLDRAEFIKGFRAPPKSMSTSTNLKRLFSLLKEFSPISKSEKLKKYKNKVVIPGDFFINWRKGLRSLVPIWVTVFRFRRALDHACKNDGIVHIWLHPHNLLTGKNQMQLLRMLLAVAEEYRGKGSLKILTQSDCVSE